MNEANDDSTFDDLAVENAALKQQLAAMTAREAEQLRMMTEACEERLQDERELAEALDAELTARERPFGWRFLASVAAVATVVLLSVFTVAANPIGDPQPASISGLLMLALVSGVGGVIIRSLFMRS